MRRSSDCVCAQSSAAGGSFRDSAASVGRARIAAFATAPPSLLALLPTKPLRFESSPSVGIEPDLVIFISIHPVPTTALDSCQGSARPRLPAPRPMLRTLGRQAAPWSALTACSAALAAGPSSALVQWLSPATAVPQAAFYSTDAFRVRVGERWLWCSWWAAWRRRRQRRRLPATACSAPAWPWLLSAQLPTLWLRLLLPHSTAAEVCAERAPGLT